MKVASKRDVALWIIHLMVAWVFLRLIMYLVMPRDSMSWLIMAASGVTKTGAIGALVLTGVVTAIWLLFGWWVLKSSPKIAARIVLIDGETGRDSENTFGDVLRLVICCVGLLVATEKITAVAAPIRLIMMLTGGRVRYAFTGEAFPFTFLLSLFAVFRPHTVARWTRACPAAHVEKPVREEGAV